MDIVLLLSSPLIVTLFIAILIFRARSNKAQPIQCRNLPPSPSPELPIIGHLHLLEQPLHRTLQRLSQKYGPIISLKLGSRRVVVVSSPAMVKECFTNSNDVVFSNRPKSLVDKYIGYSHTTMAGAEYGQHWRSLRRLGAQEVLSPSRLDAFSALRQDEVRRSLRRLIADASRSEEGTRIELRPRLFELIFNTVMRMFTGERCSKGGGGGGPEKFRRMVEEVFHHAQSSNPEDFLPFLKWIDYRGLKKKMANLGKRLDELYQSLLEDHRKEKKRSNTIIGHLLFLQETDPQLYTDQVIKGFITNVVIAGTDTSVVAIEWAMTLLLSHENVLKKARRELDSVIGHHRLIEECDLSRLPYLKNVVSETLRMFPPGPLSLPRESSSDCKVGGYTVPRGTILLVNAWAIQRDPKVWPEPDEFRPERFDGAEHEAQNLVPFGMGRRACPGSGLGLRMVGLVLGSLIHCFEWECFTIEEIGLEEGIGLTTPKLKPLEALCKPREFLLDIFQE